MTIHLTQRQAREIVAKTGAARVPNLGVGVRLPGDTGSIEHEPFNHFRWIGTESELVRLNHRMGVLRSANHPVCHCGSGKMPGIMRADLPRIGKRSQWCCGVCHNDRRHCPGENKT